MTNVTTANPAPAAGLPKQTFSAAFEDLDAELINIHGLSLALDELAFEGLANNSRESAAMAALIRAIENKLAGLDRLREAVWKAGRPADEKRAQP